jgi:hypothetical protein
LLLSDTEKNEYGLILDGNPLEEVPYVSFENMWLYPHNCGGHLLWVIMISNNTKMSRYFLETKIWSDRSAVG